MLCRKINGSRVVGIATGYGLDYLVLISTTVPIRCTLHSLHFNGHRVSFGYGLDYLVLISTTVPIRCTLHSLHFNGHRVSFPWAKCPLCKIDHLSPSSAEVENEWICTSVPPICLCGLGRDHLTFYIFPCLDKLTFFFWDPYKMQKYAVGRT
jgi:hypothetical protein